MTIAVDSIDWGGAWKEYQASRRSADSADYWNERAKTYTNHKRSGYTEEFLRLADVRLVETVLDMGCGPGTLALPLAKVAHRVYGCDFSTAMLEQLKVGAVDQGVEKRIYPMELAWGDDWDAKEVPVCDVAIASRSIITDDLEDALRKLDAHAGRRVCITMNDGTSPRIDATLEAVIGRKREIAPEYRYAMNILWEMGRQPELVFIESERDDLFDTREEAFDKHREIMECNGVEEAALYDYVRGHMHQVETEDGPKWRFNHDRINKWAFIAWNK